ncbi:MAG: cell division protein ZipA C-terminal FtsZ-binding domain-containing protein, partial [Pseudomonadota bacterium]
LEPGRFILSEMAQLETPGVALFMQLPAVIPGTEALQLMLEKAQQLAEQLGAELCDGQRQPLDEEAVTALEKRAAVFTKANDSQPKKINRKGAEARSSARLS